MLEFRFIRKIILAFVALWVLCIELKRTSMTVTGISGNKDLIIYYTTEAGFSTALPFFQSVINT